MGQHGIRSVHQILCIQIGHIRVEGRGQRGDVRNRGEFKPHDAWRLVHDGHGLFHRPLSTGGVHQTSKAVAPVVHDADTKPTFASCADHRDAAGFEVEVQPVGLLAQNVPLCNTGCLAGLADGSANVLNTLHGSIWQHAITPPAPSKCACRVHRHRQGPFALCRRSQAKPNRLPLRVRRRR